MSSYLIWFTASGLLIGLEMLTGTFYLLIVGLAAAAGGLFALLGLSLPLQLLAATGSAGLGLFFLRSQRKARSVAKTDPMALDIGKAVQVQQWHDDRHARVRYRGAEWDAELVQALQDEPVADTVALMVGTASLPPRPQLLYIVGLWGNTLLLGPRPPTPADELKSQEP